MTVATFAVHMKALLMASRSRYGALAAAWVNTSASLPRKPT
jgi:hypothetical protein